MEHLRKLFDYVKTHCIATSLVSYLVPMIQLESFGKSCKNKKNKWPHIDLENLHHLAKFVTYASNPDSAIYN